MNDEQLKLIKRYIQQEKKDAESMEGESESGRQYIKKILHGAGMKEFRRLGKPKNANPPTKLTDKECSSDCFFCHPELLQEEDQDLSKI